MRTLKKNKGFTLIELLVVIAIIGLLSSIVLASLNNARRKSRDARRIADIKQIQVGLELYFDDHGEYPDDIYVKDSDTNGLGPKYMSVVSLDPTGGQYPYKPYLTSSGGVVLANECGAGATCLYYHVGANLEDSGGPALSSDRDVVGSVIKGTDTADCAGATSGRYCFDVTP